MGISFLIIGFFGQSDTNLYYTEYIVEKCEEGSGFWEKVPVLGSGPNCQVKDLTPGKKYRFRVKAANLYGVSDACETDKPTLAKNPFGESVSYSVCKIYYVNFRVK